MDIICPHAKFGENWWTYSDGVKNLGVFVMLIVFFFCRAADLGMAH